MTVHDHALCRDPKGVVDGCSSYRNCCTSPTWVGEATVVRAMGLEDDWNHPPFFDYVERWMAAEVDGGGSASSDVVETLYQETWNAAPVGTACN